MKFGMSRGALRGIVVLLSLMLVIGAANLIVTGRDKAQLQREATSLQQRSHTVCSFWSDIGTAPVVTRVGSQSRTSKLGVTIVTDARKAWYGLNCPGKLGAPSTSLVFWAHHYGIRLPAEDVAVGQG